MADNDTPAATEPMMCDGCEETKQVEPTPDGRALLCTECMAETRRDNPEWIGPE